MNALIEHIQQTLNEAVYNKDMDPVESQEDLEKAFEERTRRHIGLVTRAGNTIADALPEFEDLRGRVKDHDASKLVEPERTPYIWVTRQYYCKDHNLPFICPEGMQEKMNAATKSHVSNNRHHPEFHLADQEASINREDRDKSDIVVDASAMPDLDVAEMVSDWQAMGIEKGNSARDWFNKVRNTRWAFSEHQEELINRLLKVFENAKSTN